MEINNVELIRSLLVFPEYKDGHVVDEKQSAQMKARQASPRNNDVDQRDVFYTVQLIQRQKDNPKRLYANKNFRNNSNRTIQQFQIYSLNDFDLKVPSIIEQAKLYQARAYIELNLKDSKDVYAAMQSNMTERFKTSNYTKLHRLFNEAVGETPTAAHTRKTWLVDIDTKDAGFIENVKATVKSLRGGGKGGFGEVYAEIQTKNGFHLITSSFQMDEFKKTECGAGLDVWKNNPTILWMETDWSDDIVVAECNPVFNVVQKREVEAGFRPYTVDAPDWVMFFVEKDGKYLCERLFRFGSGKEMLELPSGMSEPGEDPLDAAVRELREETGIEILDKAAVTVLTPMAANPALFTNKMHYFHIDLDKTDRWRIVEKNLDEHEHIETGWMDKHEFVEKFMSQCGSALAAGGFFQLKSLGLL